MDLKIEYIDVDKLTPYEKNARIHKEADIQTIIESIKEFGFNDAVGVWGKQNTIVEGHGRLSAAMILQMKKIPVVVLPKMTEEQKTAYALIHNKLTKNTDFDLDKLNAELQSIESLDLSKYSFEINPQSFFEEQEEEEVKTASSKNQIVVMCDDTQAEKLRDFLNDKGLEYREK